MANPLLNKQMTEAATNGNVAEMERLLAEGADISFGETDNPLLQAACKGKIEAMQWLLDRGSPIDRQDNTGKWTPLMCTAYYGHVEATRFLLERGACKDLLNYKNQTALDCAREMQKVDAAQALENTPEEISYFYPVSNRVMQEIYNFPRRERLTLIRNGNDGPVEAMQRDSFSSLDDVSGLRKAFAEHKRLGGKLAEGDVLPTGLIKAKVLRKEI